MRAPEQPRGWPSAMAPPSALTLSSSSPRRRTTASAWAAKASFSSTASTSPACHPARARAFCVAGTGPRPMRWGWTPADADVTIRARGVSPYRRTASALATTSAAAPSDSGEEEPAVTTPSWRKTVRSAPSLSSVVPGRGPSSRVTSPSFVGTGTISRSKRPASRAATARW